MHRDHEKFAKHDTIVVSIGPEDRAAFSHYWQEHQLRFIGLPDHEHSVLKLYGQQVKIFKLGRQPAQMLVDKNGVLRYVHYGASMSDIPEPEELLALIDNLEATE